MNGSAVSPLRELVAGGRPRETYDDVLLRAARDVCISEPRLTGRSTAILRYLKYRYRDFVLRLLIVE